MRRQLQGFLPVVLLALAIQVLAPIATCWAAAIVAADPLLSAAICHNGTSRGQSDHSGGQPAHDGPFATCCMMHAGAWVDTPKYVAVITVSRRSESVVWLETARLLSLSRVGSNTQARAPPRLT